MTVGEPVVAAGGLVGQVIEASHSTAQVQLITDSRSSVGVGVRAENQIYADGRRAGTGSPLSVEYIPAQTPLHKGETAVHERPAGAAVPGRASRSG